MSVAEHLKQPTRATGLKTDFEPGCPARGRPYLVLLPVGFTVPALLPTRAVRSYRTLSPLLPHAGACFGGLLSVALSLGLPPAAVSRHRVSMEPGLSSDAADGPKDMRYDSDRPADWSGAYRTLMSVRQDDLESRLIVPLGTAVAWKVAHNPGTHGRECPAVLLLAPIGCEQAYSTKVSK